jgi:secondary thiamine-phosphate synthase enzyme
VEAAGRNGAALATRDDPDLRSSLDRLAVNRSEILGLSPITTVTPDVIASAELKVETPGEGFLDITADIEQFILAAEARNGAVTLFLRHTSASLTIQENADPDVLRDLISALRHLAPRDFGWIHDSEGPDDMPAHVRTMLTGVSLQIPVFSGRLQLGTWQGIYLIEHRARPHRRQIVLQFTGSRD